MKFLSVLAGAIWKKLPSWGRSRITRLTQPTFTVSVAGVITGPDGRVLLLNHLLRPHSGWGLPGGFINAGEQPEDAFRREIREETGLEIEVLGLIRIRTLKRHVEILYLAKTDGTPEVNSREIIEFRWFEPDAPPPEMNLDQQFLIRKVLRPDG